MTTPSYDNAPVRGLPALPNTRRARPNTRVEPRDEPVPGRVLARGLGLASLGLGAAQVLAPSAVAREAGLMPTDGTNAAIRVIGVRELSVVPGLLLSKAPAGWLWARVGGDLVDLALLGRALEDRCNERDRTARSLRVVAGITALDLLAALRAGGVRPRKSLHLTAALTVNKSPDEVYGRWRDFERLPEFMTHLEAVENLGGGRSRWRAKGPFGGDVVWEAELVADEPGHLLAWCSTKGAKVPNSGDVTFTPAPGGRGTEVRVHLDYDLPAGRLGAKVARMLGEDPHQQVEDDLRRFKQVVETGEVVRSSATPEGTRARRHLLQRPGQPPER